VAARHLKPIEIAVVVLFGAFATFAYWAFVLDKKSDPAPVASVPPPALDESSCFGCASSSAKPTYTFIGVYADASCKTAIVQSLFTACSAIHVSGTVEALLTEPWARHEQYANVSVRLGRQLGRDELAHVFKLVDGTCAPFSVSTGIKVTPLGCDGKKICVPRGQPPANANATYACDSTCARDAKGCPSYEGTMAYVTFTE